MTSISQKFAENTRQFSNKLVNQSPSVYPSEISKDITNIKNGIQNVTGIANNVGNLVAKITSGTSIGNALTGTSGSFQSYSQEDITGLKGFYSKMDGYGDIGIDTLNTFDCYMKFYPSNSNVREWIQEDKINNLSEGQKFSYYYNKEYDQKQTDYINLEMIIQRFNLPTIQLAEKQRVDTPTGNYIMHGGIIKTDSNTFSMEVLNLNKPIIERVFYPWMREVSLPTWSYEERPFTVANIDIDFTEHQDCIYHFIGCRPINIVVNSATQEPTSQITRQITFAFDYMFIQTDKNNYKNTDQNYMEDKGKKFKMTDNKVLGTNLATSTTKSSGTSTANKIVYSLTNILKI